MAKLWENKNNEPKHTTFSAKTSGVVTNLILSRERIITATDDHAIYVHSPATGALLCSLTGHNGGVWALAASEDTLVSGSTDRTVRVWDLVAGRCTHVFGGHAGTVRALAVVEPERVHVQGHADFVAEEGWPKRPLIVSASRDHSLRVWTLPRPGEQEYRHAENEDDPASNPYFKLHLEGHVDGVRAIAAKGRTIVSGSYDHTVRVWDIVTGECQWIFLGHTAKVYSVTLDPSRHQACSGSMDSTVRIWNIQTGECQHILERHTSLVGLLSLSPSYLVSAAADTTLCVWNPDTGVLLRTFATHKDAVTCVQHDDVKVLSGSDRSLFLWDVRDGSVVRTLLTNVVSVWQVAFSGRWCVAASYDGIATNLDVWDFGDDSSVNDSWVTDRKKEQNESTI